jgi:DeoR family fructose operon transcriptional repressor
LWNFIVFDNVFQIMTTYDRRQLLVDLLHKQPGMSVPELGAALGVSQGTIRNDLNALEQESLLKRVHGGAILTDEDQFQNRPFQLRYKEHTAAKFAIARAAAALVNNGDSIFLDASSTSYYVARCLSDRQRLRAVTNGIDVARLLAQNLSNTSFLIGGMVNNDSASVVGLLSEQIVKDLHFQKALVSCSGFSLERGMTEVHLAEAQLKRRVVESAQQVIALIDSSKFGKEDLTPFVRLENITYLYTDSGLSPEWIERLNRAGVKFTICTEEVVSP